MAKIRTELLSRLKKADQKGRKNIYISNEVWDWLMTWCEEQDPPRKASQVLEELVRMLREQETKK